MVWICNTVDGGRSWRNTPPSISDWMMPRLISSARLGWGLNMWPRLEGKSLVGVYCNLDAMSREAAAPRTASRRPLPPLPLHQPPQQSQQTEPEPVQDPMRRRYPRNRQHVTPHEIRNRIDSCEHGPRGHRTHGRPQESARP